MNVYNEHTDTGSVLDRWCVQMLFFFFRSPFLCQEREKTNKHKEFWRDTPWFVSRLSVDMSHLSRHLSRLSRGHSAP